jgi:hypothetical protein
MPGVGVQDGTSPQPAKRWVRTLLKCKPSQHGLHFGTKLVVVAVAAFAPSSPTPRLIQAKNRARATRCLQRVVTPKVEIFFSLGHNAL